MGIEITGRWNEAKVACCRKSANRTGTLLAVVLAIAAIGVAAGCTNLAGSTTPPIASQQLSLQFSPASLNFGTVASGKKTGQNGSVTNTSANAATIAAIISSSNQFTTSGLTFPLTIAPSQTVKFMVWFNGSGPGKTAGTLTFQGSDGTMSAAQIAVTATDITPQPQLVVSTASLDAGSATVGSKTTSNITLTNSGTADLAISVITVAGTPFSVSGITTPAVISAGQSAPLSVVYAPTAARTDSGSITISSNDPSSPKTIALSGTGTSSPVGHLTLNPSTLAFGNVSVGATSVLSATVTNSGQGVVHISSVFASGSGYSETGIATPATLAAGQSAQVQVKFAPTATGTTGGTVGITSDAPGAAPGLALTGTGVQAGISVSPASINFGSLIDGQTKSLPVVITNTGSANLTITQVSSTGPGLSVSGVATPLTIAAGQSSTLTARFAPQTAGVANGSISLTTNASSSPTVVALNGTGVAATATLSVSPASLSFGNVNVGASANQTVTITNTGNTSTTISQIAVTGQNLAVNGVNLPLSLAAAQSATLTVQFSPTTSTTTNGTISIVSQGGTSPVGVTGTGVQAGINVSPASVSFGSLIDGQTKTLPVVIANTGTANLTITQVTSTGTGLSVSGVTTPLTIAAGQSTTLTAQFAPQTAGAANGSISLSSNASSSPTVVALSGTGVAATATLSVSPASLSFGNVNVGGSANQTITITNTGNSATTVSQIGVTGQSLAVSGVSTPLALAASQSATLTVQFSPTTSTTTNGTISIVSQGGTSPVGVTGTGVQAGINVSPASVSFGSLIDGQTKTLPVVIANTGTANLTITQVTSTGTGLSVSGVTTPLTIAAGQSTTLTAQFAPQTAGAANGSISLSSNASSSPTVVALSGTGVAATATLSVSPASLSFGNVNVGGSANQTITITNTGNSATTVSQIGVTGQSLAVSGVSTPLALAASQSATLTVQFSPTTTATTSGTISILSSGGTTPIGVTGTGAQASLSLSQNNVSFANITTGTSNSQALQITNSGNSGLTITQANVTGSAFSLSGLSLPAALTAGQKVSINVVFLPQSAGTTTGSVAFVSNASGSPATVTLSGSSTAATHTLSVSAGSLNFGNVNAGSTSTKTLTLANTGNADVAISQISASGTGFALSGAAGVTLSAGQNTSFSVLFNPSAAGSDTGSVSIVSNAIGSPAAIALSGTGVALQVQHSVQLGWTGSTSTVSGYNVYRSTTSGGGYVQVNGSLVTPDSYVDGTVQDGTTYYYVTTAVDGSGTESGYSNEAQAIVP
jgi:Abnormal spindle-like microcephaly-assoc'd, ASPM-SPD-2-Hydin/Protein of unknown function (DUF1573)